MDTKMILIIGVGIVIALLLMRYVQDDMSPMQRSVTTELRNYGYADVNVQALSDAQVAELDQIMRSDRGTAEIQGLIATVIRRPSE